MNIVCTHQFRMLLSKMEEFRMDLGKSYTGKDDKGYLKSNIKDSFVLDFKKNHHGFIYKVGVLGPISLYTYTPLPEDKLWVYKDSTHEKIVIDFDYNEAEIDIEKYLAELIMRINN